MLLTCKDLWALDMEGFLPHDPAAQDPGEPLCDCASRPPAGFRELGGISTPSGPWDDVQACGRIKVYRSGSVEIRLCCRCAEGVGDDVDGLFLRFAEVFLGEDDDVEVEIESPEGLPW